MIRSAVAALAALGIGTSCPAQDAGQGKPGSDEPLVTSIWTADPAAHVFDGRIYVYTSHDIDAGVPPDALGGHFAMRDYHVLHMDAAGRPAKVGPLALSIEQVPWASKQLWAPDAAYRNGTYFLYFPAKDRKGVFRIGVATSKSPLGPFTAEAEPMADAVSIDPAVFTDDDGKSYLYSGGMWGGQLQHWASGEHDPTVGDGDILTPDAQAVSPRVARLDETMKKLAEKPRGVVITDEAGVPLRMGDHERRFFEAAWVFKRSGVYYFLYSTGDTHHLAYATGSSPYGPFRFRGYVLKPVSGWTTHGSIVQHNDRWWLFYADSKRSGGKDWLRDVKVTEVEFAADGSIPEIDPGK